jgi:hypothetical protein
MTNIFTYRLHGARTTFAAILRRLRRDFFYLLCLNGGLLSPAFSAELQAADPVCGSSSGLRYYSEAIQVKSGPCVELLTLKAQAGEPVDLRFFVSEKRSGRPLEKLQVQHEKFMHVIGVREDLNEFFHIHPRNEGPGLWVASHTFAKGGKYKIWADIAVRGAVFSLAEPLLLVSGEQGAASKPATFADSVTVSGFEVSLAHTEPLIAPGTNEFVFTLRDRAGAVIDTEDFLGAPMHMVVLKEDLSDYRHAHPEPRAPGASDIRFRQILDQPGKYKVFAQFRPLGSHLPREEAMMVEFYLNVVSAKSVAGRRQ